MGKTIDVEPKEETTGRSFVTDSDVEDVFEVGDSERDINEPTKAVEKADPRDAAVAAAAEAFTTMPGVAGRDEFLSLAGQARMISLSGAAPEAVRNNPYVAFHVAMVGRDLGLSPTAAIELIDVIPGRGGPQLSLSPQLMNAQVHRVYGGEIVKANSQTDRCTAVAIGPGGRDPRCRRVWPTTSDGPLHVEGCTCDVIGMVEFTWEDARMAGLVGPDCQPGHHVKNQRRGDRTVCGCNQGYITYPKRMMWQRACGFAADDYFPGAGLGLYTPEALGAVVDVDGRPIDPATVALPEGYEDPREIQAQRAAEKEELAPEDERAAIQERIDALPEAVKDDLRDKWKKAKLPAPDKLWVSQMRKVRAMLTGFESKANRLAAQTPQDDAGVSAPADPPEGPENDVPAPEPEPERHPSYPSDENEQRRVIAAELAEIEEDCDPALVKATADTVKAMSWQAVDKALHERDEVTTGLHVDSRRMLLTAILLAESPMEET